MNLYVKVGVLILSLLFFFYNINIKNSDKKKHSFIINCPRSYSYVCDRYIYKKMSNLYSDGELCYLQTLIVFIFFIASFVPFRCCAFFDLQQMHTYMLENTSTFYYYENMVRSVVVVVVYFCYIFHIIHPLKVECERCLNWCLKKKHF